ncbi:unnamed protein product [Didymodactylos carnosus]|uniref:Uncharacterized protein n=1 Tax=Didymodactylos carnosus TaxID=1234261 RepID=A0A813Q5G6_9BILA|nr:unnamed protein product [Didymodactylos carnosus]CAF3543238.1 unnamed protein product [Didymodactylos carnosus]
MHSFILFLFLSYGIQLRSIQCIDDLVYNTTTTIHTKLTYVLATRTPTCAIYIPSECSDIIYCYHRFTCICSIKCTNLNHPQLWPNVLELNLVNIHINLLDDYVLYNLTVVQTLNFKQSYIEVINSKTFLYMPFLKQLSFEKSYICVLQDGAFYNKYLERLDLIQTKINYIADEFLFFSSSLNLYDTSLTTLTIINTNLTKLPSDIKYLKNLIKLTLINNWLTYIDENIIKQLKNLKYLYIDESLLKCQCDLQWLKDLQTNKSIKIINDPICLYNDQTFKLHESLLCTNCCLNKNDCLRGEYCVERNNNCLCISKPNYEYIFYDDYYDRPVCRNRTFTEIYMYPKPKPKLKGILYNNPKRQDLFQRLDDPFSNITINSKLYSSFSNTSCALFNTYSMNNYKYKIACPYSLVHLIGTKYCTWFDNETCNKAPTSSKLFYEIIGDLQQGTCSSTIKRLADMSFSCPVDLYSLTDQDINIEFQRRWRDEFYLPLPLSFTSLYFYNALDYYKNQINRHYIFDLLSENIFRHNRFDCYTYHRCVYDKYNYKLAYSYLLRCIKNNVFNIYYSSCINQTMYYYYQVESTHPTYHIREKCNENLRYSYS